MVTFKGLVLQAYTYTVINQCSLPANQIATLLGYLHIAFQPFFANAVALFFIDQRVSKKIAAPVYFLCFVAAISMLIQVYPFDWAGVCNPKRPLCGPLLCSVSGNWHIAWEVPTNGIGNYFVDSGIPFLADGYPGYTLTVFWLPVLYGSWRVTLYQLLMGPMLAGLLTNNINEWPAVWCLLSIGLLLIVVTPMRRLLYVKRCWFWPKRWLV